MAKQKKKQMPWGKWAFLLGLIVAILAAFITAYGSIVMAVLFVLGLVVGFMNIAEKDTVKFLVASMSLLVLGAASLGALAVLGTFGGTLQTYLNSILGNYVAFVSASVLVVSIKALLETSK